MNGDFSLNPLAYRDRVSRVMIQQGRVQLDSDANEQTETILRFLRGLASDLIGAHGGVKDSFQIFVDATTKNLSVRWGEYYVDGIRCVNLPHGTFSRISPARANPINTIENAPKVIYDVQAGYPSAVPIDFWSVIGYPEEVKALGNGLALADQTDYAFPKDMPQGTVLFYLDVFERHIAPAQDSSMIEVALLGPDTASRAVIVWQVRVCPFDQVNVLAEALTGANTVPPTYDPLYLALNLLLRSSGRMAAQAVETEATDPCIIAADARYRGFENRLYRVEIHDPGTPDGKTRPTFKWSRDNGSIVYAVSAIEGKTVHLDSLGRDERTAIEVNDWVEVVDDDVTLNERVNPLLQVTAVQRDTMTITLSDEPVVRVGDDLDAQKPVILRRWETNVIEIQEARSPREGWIKLTDGQSDEGVEVQFSHFDLVDAKALKLPQQPQLVFHKFRSGDYWLVPARTATGDVIWPRDHDPSSGASFPRPVSPHGTEHHFAPLATRDATATPVDKRRTFDPMAK